MGRIAMPLLQTAVTVDITKSFEYTAAFLVFLLLFTAIVLTTGFSLRIGKREFCIGGLRRLLMKKDRDVLLKEELCQYAEHVDNDTASNLYDLIEDLDGKIKLLPQSEHCWFTWEKFNSVIKNELYKRVRRNNLKEKLMERRESYIAGLLREIEKKYEMLRGQVALNKCSESYEEFSSIRKPVREMMEEFFDKAKEALVCGCKKKIQKYNETKERFRTADAKQFCCLDRIEKNKGYIRGLTGKEPLV